MFTALHPLLLWGTAAVAVPVLIHLLLRQRPKPRPWAAMRWLLAAAQAAQRRYRLTNLLLLLLRCLAVLLVALAVARPSLTGVGGGERLVLVVDASASMGARGTDPGPLAAFKAALAATPPEVASAALVVVGREAQVLADGPRAKLLDALARVEVVELPGGLDRLAEGANAAVLAQVLTSGADVLFVSDFQQDDGAKALALCQGRCRSAGRWCVGRPAPNALITGVAVTGDAVPDQPGEVALTVAGPVRGAAVAVDDGPFLAAPAVAAGATALRLVTPPLAEGAHRVRLRIDDDGLAYDNVVELPLIVRPAVPVLVIQERIDYLGAALAADTRSLACRSVRPAVAATEALPEHGLVALRAPMADTGRLVAWVEAGGVLWTTQRLCADDARLRPLIAAVAVASDTVAGGEFLSGLAELDEVLRTGRRERVLRSTLPGTATVLLRAGTAPLVALIPAGRGGVVVELDELAGDRAFEARGTTPAWVARMVRQVTARQSAPRIWQAGMAAPAATALERNGRFQAVTVGAPLLIPPGLWRDPQGAVVVLPNREEARIDRTAPAGTVTTIDQALPRRPGRDWGLMLALAALAIVMAEGLIAAWAGRRYGR